MSENVSASSYSQKSLKKNAVLNIIKTAIGLLFPLITFPYVSRVLEPSGIGRVNYARSVVQYFALFAALGINAYGIREGSKIRTDKNAFSLFVKEILIINLISTLVTYIIFFIVIFLVPAFNSYLSLLLVSSIIIFFTTIGVDWAYSALEEYGYITVRSIVFQVISLVLLFVFVRRKEHVMAYAVVGAISSVGSNLLNFIHLRKFVDLNVRETLSFRKHLKPIFILFSTSVAISLYTFLDTVMLGLFCGDEETGYYTAATRINAIVIGMITAVGVVLRPRLSNYAENNTNNYESLLNVSCNMFLMLTIPSVVGLCFLSEPVMLFFCGERFSAAIPVMKIITPVIFFITFGQFFSDQIFLPFRKDFYSFIPVLTAGILNIGMNFIFIPRFGAIGAAVATVFSECIVCTIKLFLSFRVYKDTMRLFKNLWQYIFATMCMYVALFFLSKLLSISTIFDLLLFVISGAFTYVLVMLLFKNEFVLQFIHFLQARSLRCKHER